MVKADRRSILQVQFLRWLGAGLVFVVPILILSACAEEPEDEGGATVPPRYLYVATGTCYAGQGNTAFTNLTSSNLVYRVNLQTGLRDRIIADYNAAPAQPGDTPSGLAISPSGTVFVAVDNTVAGARRIEQMPNEANATRTLFTGNTTALSAALRNLVLMSNGDLMVSKSSAVERFTSSGVRITKGANPYISAPAAPCATSTTLLNKIGVISNGLIYFSHAAASQNRFGFVKASGYGIAGDCSPAQAAPVATAYPSAVAYDSANSNLIVAYSGNTLAADINSIYVYPLIQGAGAVNVGTGIKVYDASEFPGVYPYLLYGITHMQLDLVTNKLYVSTANASVTAISNFQIEALNYSPSMLGVNNQSVLTRPAGAPFYNYGADTKCISQMAIAN